ncbi:MAG: methyl-accepting chemotaxis protein [Acidobacteriota bacterium]
MLKRLKIWQKLTLIALVFVLVIPFVLYLIVSERLAEQRNIERRLVGLEYIESAFKIFVEIPRHRGQTNAFLNGNAAARAEAEGHARVVNEALEELRAIDQRVGRQLQTREPLQVIGSTWAELAGEAYRLRPEESWVRHTELIREVLQLLVAASDYSGLGAEPEIGKGYVVRALVQSAPRTAEFMGQLRGLGSGYAARPDLLNLPLTSQESAELIYLVRSIESDLLDLEQSLDIAANEDSALAGELQRFFDAEGVAAAVRSYTELAQENIIDAEETVDLDSSTYFSLGTEAIAPIAEIQNRAVRQLRTSFEASLDALKNEITIVIVGVLLAALLTLALVVLIARSITGQVGRLNDLFGEINRGRYETRSAVTSSDELGQMTGSLNTMLDNTLVLIQDRAERDQIQGSIRRLLEQVSDVADGDLRRDLEVTEDITGSIADSFNYMLEELRTLIGDVQQTTSQVTGAAAGLASTSQELAAGSRRQTSEIESTAQSVRDLSESAQQVSANAERSTQVANQALASARAGTEAVERTIDGMGKIRQRVQDTSKRIKRLGESSQQIGEIVELISDLADRTSLLALNASIQAASAGEAGRSFAVVAKEVEQLADRSTDSTKRISQLITNIQRETAEASSAMEDTTREVVEGSEVASEAGRALEEIGAVSNQLADLADQILTRARRQAEISDGVADAIGQIDSISRLTSGGAEETMSGLSELAEMAQKLRSSVDAFRLPQNPSGSVQNAA